MAKWHRNCVPPGTAGWFFACLLAVAFLAATLPAQTRVSVSDLRARFDKRYKNEQVSIRGWVESRRRVSSRTFKAYYLRDQEGSLILVRTTSDLPRTTSEIVVTGIALRNADSEELYIAETRRDAAGAEKPGASQAASSAPAEESQPIPLQHVAIGTGVLIFLVLLRSFVRRKSKPAPDGNVNIPRQASYLPPIHLPTPRPRRPKEEPRPSWRREEPQAPRPAEEPKLARPVEEPKPAKPPEAPKPAPQSKPADDYKTVKVYKTTKVLPGKLIVLENRRETDAISLFDQSGRGEIEIGRESPEITVGIRIKDTTNTVSRRQALLLYLPDTRQFKLQNLAGSASNPTIINGREMSEKECVALSDGDILLMGSVELKFRASGATAAPSEHLSGSHTKG